MKTTVIIIICLNFHLSLFAQDTENEEHSINIVIPEVAMIDLESASSSVVPLQHLLTYSVETENPGSYSPLAKEDYSLEVTFTLSEEN